MAKRDEKTREKEQEKKRLNNQNVRRNAEIERHQEKITVLIMRRSNQK